MHASSPHVASSSPSRSRSRPMPCWALLLAFTAVLVSSTVTATATAVHPSSFSPGGAASSAAAFVVPPVSLEPINYKLYAHEHWVWLHHGESNQQAVLDLVQDYADHDIPVGAINIDSEWATEFNNFVVNEEKFPDFAGLVAELHSRGIKVILWATSMVNVENPDYAMCVEKGFLVKSARGIVRPIKWWHGEGGLLDYSNPDAVQWWHAQMDKVLDVGVDGFKCDGTDPYIWEYIITGGAYGNDGQKISYREYANAYYRDFLFHTNERKMELAAAGGVGGAGAGTAAAYGPAGEGMIWSRPVDCLLDPIAKGCTAFSPLDVMHAGWVGDDDNTFDGLRGCLRKVVYSAWRNYASFGCDIGGYRNENPDDTKSAGGKVLFTRWAQVGAFLPLMENGGAGEHRPWMFDDPADEVPVTDIYRSFVVAHYQLSYFLHTLGAQALSSRSSAIEPLASSDAFRRYWAKQRQIQDEIAEKDMEFGQTNGTADLLEVPFPQPSTYAYFLGNKREIFVHPLVYDTHRDDAEEAGSVNEGVQHTDSGDGTMKVEVQFPTGTKGPIFANEVSDFGSAAVEGGDKVVYWLDWFRPFDKSLVHRTGESVLLTVPLSKFPVFVRSNSFFPLRLPISYGSSATPAAAALGHPTEDVEDPDDTAVFTWFAPSARVDSPEKAVSYALQEYNVPVSTTTTTKTTTAAVLAEGEAEESGVVGSAYLSPEPEVTDLKSKTEERLYTLEASLSSHSGKMAAGVRFVGVSLTQSVAASVQVEAMGETVDLCDHIEWREEESTLTVACQGIQGGVRVSVRGVALMLP